MRKRCLLLTTLLTASLMLGGCGTPLYEMTEDEENLVVTYAAYALAKYNIYQKDGMTAAVLTEEETEETETTEKTDKTESGDAKQTDSQASDNSQSATGGTHSSISLAASIGQEDHLTVSYEGYRIQDSYQEGNYLSVNPEEGKKLVVMIFTIRNTSEKTVELNTIDLDNTFYASFDGGTSIQETVSFGAQSLSMFEGTIKSGKSKQAVLIFQVPKAQAEEISDLSLTVRLKDTTFSVKI